MDIAAKRSIVDYVAATKNEILVDERLFSLLGTTPEVLGYLPRIPKWIGWGRRFPRLTRTMSHLIRFAWLCGGAVFLFSLNFVAAWARAPRAPRPRLNMSAGSESYILALSDRVEDIMGRSPFAEDPLFADATWVCVPWVPMQSRPQRNHVDALSLLTRGDLFQAFIKSVTAVYVLWRHKHTSRWVLQSYTAFRWFVVRSALEKLDGVLITCEHYDRWAILVDSTVGARTRRHGGSGSGVEMILVQHGYMGGLGKDHEESLQLPIHRRLRAVSRMYLYDAAAKKFFMDAVVSRGRTRRGIATTFFRPQIELTAMPAEKLVKILFVGHPLCEELHLSIINKLVQHARFAAYYKPHPKAAMSGKATAQEWTVINDPACFPAVDFLVSYPSTLVTEYEATGIPAQTHPLDLDPANSDGLVRQILDGIAMHQRRLSS